MPFLPLQEVDLLPRANFQSFLSNEWIQVISTLAFTSVALTITAIATGDSITRANTDTGTMATGVITADTQGGIRAVGTGTSAGMATGLIPHTTATRHDTTVNLTITGDTVPQGGLHQIQLLPLQLVPRTRGHC
jgi:hypothetical protein